MFFNTKDLNEGGCRDKCFGSRKRELQEGKNPKINNEPRISGPGEAHVNAHWQNLRK